MAETAAIPRATLMDRLGFMTADEAVRAVRELCVPLGSDEYSLHGNIWPGNIFFDEDGKALLGEPSDKSAARRTADQVEYLAPEYFWTDEGGAAADVYSLGLMLYAACNGGYLPFQPKGGALTEKDRAVALRRRMKGEHIPVPEGMSRGLGVIVRRALAYREEQRYVSAAELLQALNTTDEALPTAGRVIDIAAAQAAKAALERERAAARAAKAKKMPAAETVPEVEEASEPEEKMTRPAKGAEAERPAPEKPAKTKKVPEEKSRTKTGKAPAEIKKEKSGKKPAEEKKARQAKQPEKAKKTPEKTVRQPEAEPAAPRTEERKYTVQKDFERRTRLRKDASAAPVTRRRRKKRTSPAIVLLSLVAVGILAATTVRFVLPGIQSRMQLQAPVDEPQTPADEAEAPAAPVHSAAPMPLTMVPAVEGPADAPAEEPAAEETAAEPTPVDDTVYASDSGVSLRTGPGTSYPTAQSLSRGTQLHRTAVVGGWSLVEYEGQEYYVSSALIEVVPPETDVEEPIVSTVEDAPVKDTVNTVTVRSSANLRTGPGTSNAVVATVNAGAVMETTGQENGWCRVVYGGKEVYISNKLVSEGGDPADIIEGGADTDAGSVGTITVLQPANIRAAAGTDAAVIGQVDQGVKLSVIGFTPPKWYRVNYNGREGYINSNMVNAGDLALENGTSARVQVKSPVHLRSGPGTRYQILGTAQTGETFVVLGSSNGWYQVSYNGATAYVAGNFVKKLG